MKETALIRFEGYELDPRARSLTLDGARIALSPKSFDLLLYLAEHPHEVISKDRLLSAVWPDSFVEESNLSQHVFLVRKALAASGHGERIVITIPGKGYQFAAPVEVVSLGQNRADVDLSYQRYTQEKQHCRKPSGTTKIVGG